MILPPANLLSLDWPDPARTCRRVFRAREASLQGPSAPFLIENSVVLLAGLDDKPDERLLRDKLGLRLIAFGSSCRCQSDAESWLKVNRQVAS
jgi:hypothetical protein